jgi:hypothetical protein
VITSCAGGSQVWRGFLLPIVLGVLLVFAGPGAQAAGSAPTGSALSAGSVSSASVSSALSADTEGTVDRKITDKRITESSGLATSLLHPGVLWTNNDSGNPPRIYAISPKGSTEATLKLRGEPNIDWEAITTLRAPDGRALIAVGDIGDNNAQHSSVRIAMVPEPDPLRTTSVTPERVLRLRYPGGPRDAEALLADPRNGRLYIVSKTLFGSELFAVPKQLWPNPPSGAARVSRLTTLTKVASMSAGLITDGVFLPDGRMLLRGYGRAFVIAKPETVRNQRLSTLADDTLPEQDQGESITVTDGGKQALIGSEGKREPVLRIPVPGEDQASAGTDTGSTEAATTPAPGAEAVGPAGSTVPAEPTFGGVGNLRVWALIIGGGIVLMVLTAGGLMFGTRRR